MRCWARGACATCAFGLATRFSTSLATGLRKRFATRVGFGGSMSDDTSVATASKASGSFGFTSTASTRVLRGMTGFAAGIFGVRTATSVEGGTEAVTLRRSIVDCAIKASANAPFGIVKPGTNGAVYADARSTSRSAAGSVAAGADSPASAVVPGLP